MVPKMWLAPEVETDESNLIESSEHPEFIPCTKPIRMYRSFYAAAVGVCFTHFSDEKLQEKAGFGNRVRRAFEWLYLQKAEHTEGIPWPEAIHMLFWPPLLQENKRKETGREMGLANCWLSTASHPVGKHA